MRRLGVALVLAICVGIGQAQVPATLMIEDFEAESTWTGVTSDDGDAREGQRSGLWIPAQSSTARSDDIPHDWSGYDRLCLWMYSEVANGQKLTLVANSDNPDDDMGWDYFYYHFTVDWSGWKHFSLRLGEDIQPTRRPVGWHKIDYLAINASGWGHQPLEDTVIRLDGVRLVRDPVSMTLVERSERHTDIAYRVVHRLQVTNRTDKPTSFDLHIEGDFNLFRPESATVHTPELAAGESIEIEITLAAPPRVLTTAEPLTCESGRVFITVDDTPPFEASVPIDAAVPLPEQERPLLFASAEEIARAKLRAERYDWAREELQGIVSRGDAALQLEVKVPDEGGQWSHHYVCSDCGVGLKARSPTEHVCPRCGKVHTGWPYDQVYIARLHHRLTRAISELGLAYAFTGDIRYAQKAREILLAYGHKYRSFPLHNVRGQVSRSAGRLYAQTLDEAVDIIRVAWGYDLIYDSGVFSDEDRDVIENGYLRAVADVIRRNDAGISNWQSWHNAGLAAIGFCLRDAELASLAINGRSGLRFQLEHSVLPDGFWYEGTAAYHFYALDALRWTAEAALHSGINFYDNAAFKSLFDAPLLYVFPDLTFPAVNDSDVFSLAGRRELYDLAYARFGDERYLTIANRGARRGIASLLWGVDELPPGPPLELPSRTFAGLGATVLRSGQGPDGVYVHLDWGPHGGGHGHPDKLALILYALGKELAPDPGRLAYGASLHRTWFRQTVAHNTVCVDEQSQRPAEGRLIAFHDGEVVRIVRAECDTAYPGVMLRRTLVLADNYLLDVYEAEAEEPHVYDWFYHNVGTLQPSFATEPMEGPLGDDAGYQHITEVSTGDGSVTWQAEFTVPEVGRVRLTQLGEPGTRLYFGTGITGRDLTPCPVAVSRRETERTTWISAIEWRPPGEGFSIESVERARVTAPDAEADNVLAVKVRRADGYDVLLVRPGGAGRVEVEGVTTDADLCFFSVRGGEVTGLEHIDFSE